MRLIRSLTVAGCWAWVLGLAFALGPAAGVPAQDGAAPAEQEQAADKQADKQADNQIDKQGADAGAASDPRVNTVVPATVEDLEAIQTKVAEVIAKGRQATVCVELGGASGSGVVVSDDGYVLTAGHVAMEPGKSVIFIFPDGKRARGKTLGVNIGVDAALMKIDGDGPWPYMEMAKTNTLKPGSWVVAMGHPGGFDQERSVVSRLGRVYRMRSTVVQSDCTIIGGDSGGPLFDLDGKVVGIHSRISTSLRQNYHVPVAQYADGWQRLAAGEVWNRPMMRGRVREGGPFIGVQGADGFALGKGAELSRITKDSPAAQAGLKPGDVVIRFDRSPVGSFGDLASLVRKLEPGDRVPVVVKRMDEELEMEIVIGKLGEQE